MLGDNIETLSSQWAHRVAKLWAHLVRADNEDLLRQTVLKNDSADRRREEKRRIGRPRLQWTEAAEKIAWDMLGPVLRGTEDNYEGTSEQRAFLAQAAYERCL